MVTVTKTFPLSIPLLKGLTIDDNTEVEVKVRISFSEKLPKAIIDAYKLAVNAAVRATGASISWSGNVITIRGKAWQLASITPPGSLAAWIKHPDEVVKTIQNNLSDAANWLLKQLGLIKEVKKESSTAMAAPPALSILEKLNRQENQLQREYEETKKANDRKTIMSTIYEAKNSIETELDPSILAHLRRYERWRVI